MNTASELVYRCGLLAVPLASASADLRETPDKISFSIPSARLGDGQCSISAQLVQANRTVDSEIEFDHVSLRSEEHTSELQSPFNLVCRLLLENKKAHV